MIHKYIKEIIEKQSRLILPDLGAFLTKDIDDKKVLFFNDVLKYNDGTLSGFVSEKEGIDISNAQLKVANYIREINNALVSESKFEIDEFGMLYKDQKGYINFRPIETEIKVEIETKNEPVVEKINESSTTVKNDILEMVTDSEEISNIKHNVDEVSAPEISIKDEILEIENHTKTSYNNIIIDEKPIEKTVENNNVIENKIIKEESNEVIENKGNLVEFNVADESNIDENQNIDDKKTVDIIENKIIDEKKKEVKTEPKKPVKDKKTIEKELKKTSSQKPKKSLKPLIIVAAIVIPLIILGAVGYVFKEKVVELVHGFSGKSEHKKEIVKVTKNVKVKDGETTTTTDSVLTQTNGETEVIKSETVTENEKTAEKAVTEETKTVTEKVSTNVSSNNSDNLKFHAIAGSFATTKEAEKFMQKLIEKGYNSQILDSGNGKIRVSYNSFSTKQEATDEVSKLTSQGLQSWVLNQ
ncbi:MAG: hypothetical protein A2046_03640 [Bacteroidetes bacterium GWA2_30_7]|nr:MAG: hypothetical protein A2046_03640 [Bacteroidetes bacterium GWA2_30_7]